jgi:hypothetical protein
LINASEQAGKEWSDSAGTAKDQILAVYPNLISGGWISIARDVRNAPANMAIVSSRWHICGILIGRLGESPAHASTRCATSYTIVPGDLRVNRCARSVQVGTAAGDHAWAGCRKIDMKFAVEQSICRAVIAGCDEHRHAECCGVLERLIHHCSGLLSPVIFGVTPAD